MMKTWPDVISKFIDFLKKPTGAGVFILSIAIIAFLVAYPWFLLGKELNETIRETSRQQISAINQITDILKDKKMAIGE